MIQDIKAYKTTDGEIFEDYAQAESHQKDIDEQRTIDAKINANLPKIKQYIKDNYKVKDPKPWMEKEWGWDCNHKDNPIGICVYDYEVDEECCVYCGEPEERK